MNEDTNEININELYNMMKCKKNEDIIKLLGKQTG